MNRANASTRGGIRANRAVVGALTVATCAGLAPAGDAPSASPATPALVAAPAPVDADGVARATLKNGLRTLVRPIENTDTVALVLLFNFGESSDPEGKSGLAHTLEHLWLTAAAGDLPATSYDELVGRYTDGVNAQTGEDYTVFAFVCPQQSLEEEIRRIGARLRGPRIEQTDLDRERPRLFGELLNMSGANPLLGARNEARERACPPAEGARRAGKPEQIQSITLEEARERLRYYSAGNATLALAGAVDPNVAMATMERLLGDIPRGDDAPPRRPSRAPVTGAVTTLSLLPAGEQPLTINAYEVPPPGADGFLETSMIVSRLQIAMTKPGVARDMRMPPAFHPALDDPRLLLVTRTMFADETPEAAAARLDKLVADACADEVTAEDRARLRTGLGPFLGLSPWPDQVALMNPYGVAFSLGRREQLKYDPGAINAALDKLTGADLRKFAESRLSPAKRANIALVPKQPR